MWLILHPCKRLVVLLPNGTLQNCHPTQPRNIEHCMPLQGLCVMPKSRLANMTHLLQHTKGSRRNFTLPTMWSWFCLDDIKRCVNGSMNNYLLDWPIVPNTWPVKIGTNLSKEDVLTFEGAGFQLQQREALSHRCRLSTITTTYHRLYDWTYDFFEFTKHSNTFWFHSRFKLV